MNTEVNMGDFSLSTVCIHCGGRRIWADKHVVEGEWAEPCEFTTFRCADCYPPPAGTEIGDTRDMHSSRPSWFEEMAGPEPQQ